MIFQGYLSLPEGILDYGLKYESKYPSSTLICWMILDASSYYQGQVYQDDFDTRICQDDVFAFFS